ncbi:MAG: 3-phosphoshikimate 1-carboxyvinyltransferase [bacterium]|nr:3-phosphoshikimate 1-carboxyvinyltransferase [bacterium]
MNLVVSPSSLHGAVRIPASKSHTIRALLIATLADGVSELHNPLESGDTLSCANVCSALGARIERTPHLWRVSGTGLNLRIPDTPLDVGNSGTTLYLALATAALADRPITFTGDYQIQRRSAQPLLDALSALGALAVSHRANGCAPITVRGPLRGGSVTLPCPTSQYLSSLLLNCPLASAPTSISVPLLNEQPYVEMTLDWLARQGISLHNDAFQRFFIPGQQRYHPFSRDIPADFSSATFFLVAAAITNSDVELVGLDMHDTQGDKAVVSMLSAMGATIDIAPDRIRVRGGTLHGTTLDLNATPDALPALAVAACFAEGETRLINVAQARIKETDRIAVMTKELRALGANVEELPDGMIIRHSHLHGGHASGHDDHRVVMALAVAGLRASSPLTVHGAEAISVTFPSFVSLMQQLGAHLQLL